MRSLPKDRQVIQSPIAVPTPSTEQTTNQHFPVVTTNSDAAGIVRAAPSEHDIIVSTPRDQKTPITKPEHPASAEPRKTCWDRALQELKTSNKRIYDDLQAIAEFKMASPDDIAQSAEAKVKQLGKIPPSDADAKKWYTCRNLLKTLSKGMSSMKDVVMPLSRLDPHGAAPVALAIVFGGIYTIVQVVALENTEYLFALTSIIEMRPMIARWVHYESHFMVHQEPDLLDKYGNLEVELTDFYQSILIFMATMTKYCGKPLIERFFNAIVPNMSDWTSQLNQIKSKDNNCKSYKEVIAGEQSFQQQNATLLSWIFEEDPKLSHKKVLERTKVVSRYPDAGQWVLELDEYRDWWTAVRHSGGSDVCTTPMCLWLDGDIGTGKTTVISRIIQQVVDLPTKNVMVAFFYFSKIDSEPKDRTLITFLRSLVRQLSWVPESKDLAEPSRSLYSTLKQGRPKSGSLLREECLDVLTQLIAGRRCRIFIDALDECSDSSDAVLVALSDLHDMVNKTPGTQLQFLISSRPYINVERHFRSLQGYTKVTTRLCVADHQPDNDLESFVVTEINEKKRKLSTLPLFNSPGLEGRLMRILLERAGSMFRWAEMQIELFTNRKWRSRESIREKLDRLETKTTRSGLSDLDKLTEAYKEVYDILKDETSSWRAELVYNLLLCAFDDLSMDYIVEAVKSVTKPEDRDEVTAEYVNDICSCFLAGHDPVRFAHASAQEFLEQHRNEENILLYAPEQQHAAAAFLCLSTIRQNENRLATFAKQEFKLEKVAPPDGFMWYSCCAWPFHCKQVPFIKRMKAQREGVESITTLMALMTSSSSFVGWQSITEMFAYHQNTPGTIYFDYLSNFHGMLVRSVPYEDTLRRMTDRNSPGLLIAAFDFVELIDILRNTQLSYKLIVPEDVNRQQESMGVLACRAGSYETLRALRLAEPQKFRKLCRRSESGRLVDSYLHRAIRSRSVKTVSFLLENGADVLEVIFPPGRSSLTDNVLPSTTTLHRAVSVRSPAVLEVLLQHAQKKLSRGDFQDLILSQLGGGKSALFLAIEESSAATINVFLKHVPSTDILRQVLYGSITYLGSALNHCAVSLYHDRSASNIDATKTVLQYSKQLPKEALQELLTALTNDGHSVRYILKDLESFLAENHPEIATIVYPAGTPRPESRIAFAEEDLPSLEEKPGDAEWYKEWKREQRLRRDPATHEGKRPGKVRFSLEVELEGSTDED